MIAKVKRVGAVGAMAEATRDQSLGHFIEVTGVKAIVKMLSMRGRL